MKCSGRRRICCMAGIAAGLLLLPGCGNESGDGKERPAGVVETAVPDGVPELVALLKREANVRSRFPRPVQPDGSEGVPPPSAALEQAVSRLASSMDPQAVDLLFQTLETGSDTAAYWAAEVLGAKGDARSIEPVWTRYRHSRPFFRAHLREVAARLPRETTVGFLMDKLGDDDYQVRLDAGELLSRIPHPKAIDALCDAMESSATQERDHAIDALVEIGEPAVPALLKAAAGKWGNRKVAAVMALSRIPSEAGLKKVFALSLSEKAAIRTEAEQALRLALSKTPRGRRLTDAQRARQEILEQAMFRAFSGSRTSREEAVRLQVIDLFGRMAIPEAAEAVRTSARRDSSAAVKAVALRIMNRNNDPAALDRALKGLYSPSDDVRRAAEGTLLRVMSAELLGRIKPALQDSSPKVRQTAVRAIRKLDIPQVRSLLIARTGDSDDDVAYEACRALHGLPRRADDERWLERLSRSSSRKVRQEVIRTLGDTDCFDTIPVLLQMLAHENSGTQNDAEDVLEDCVDSRVFRPMFERVARRSKEGIAWRVPDGLFNQAGDHWRELLPELSSQEDGRKALAAALLEEVEEPSVKQALRRLTLARDRVVACNAPHALLKGSSPDAQVVRVMVDMMQNSDWGGSLASAFLNSPVKELQDQSIRWYREHGFDVIPIWVPM